ncbi:MAG: hypothetical protein ACFFKA_15320 [Candidatus Thorarchaeota archaeon]
MLCCAGLFGGLFLGFVIGGPFIFITPALGFVLGLFGDKFMRGRQGCH